MRTTATILGMLRERGKQGLPLENVYRLLFNRNLYLTAYGRLAKNKGAMTPGPTAETADGMSLAKIDRVIEAVRAERYRWTPVRRTYIPKANGKQRPLGIPAWRDKVLQEVLRMILDAYYDPQFSDLSHGFRRKRGCHTALREIKRTWTGTNWFIEGDIVQYFDRITHDRLVAVLGEQIRDNRLLRLIRHYLRAGYLEQWKWHKTWSGTPQGGVLSPLLANLYLHKLDQYIERELIPQYNWGTRQDNPLYNSVNTQMHYRFRKRRISEALVLRKRLRALPCKLTRDPDHRRLRYIRYADDWIIGFCGPRAEAIAIKQQIAAFLERELGLELSPEKTVITHARTGAARFLGYEIVNQQDDTKRDKHGRRALNGRIALRIPADVVQAYGNHYKAKGKPTHRNGLEPYTDFTIVRQYQHEYLGIVNYYRLATNRTWLWKVHWEMKTSLLKTLAMKHKSSVRKQARRYRASIQVGEQSLSCLEVRVPRGDGKPPLVARFGGVSLGREDDAVLVDQQPGKIASSGRSELIARLLANQCEVCGSTEDVEVHHIRKMADLKQPGRKPASWWAQRMAETRRKTLVVCRACHMAIHTGQPLPTLTK